MTQEKTDAVVIGGGIVGTSTALALAQAGVRTTLCEKGRIAGEQSGRNWGWCRTFGRDRRELDLSLLSLRLWRDLNRTINRETGFRPSGILSLAKDESHRQELATFAAALEGSGHDVRMIGRVEAAGYATGAASSWPGGLLARDDGRAEPSLAAVAIAEGARELGADIRVDCPVLGIETQAGRISAVVTATGRIDCSAVVIAGGAWSTKLCRQMGVRFAQLRVDESVMRTAPLDGGPTVSLRTREFSLRKRLDGGYTVGGGGKIYADITPDSFRFVSDFIPILRAYWRYLRLRLPPGSLREWSIGAADAKIVNTLDPAPDIPLLNRVHASLVRAFPAFADVQIAERWAGSIDVTPDAIPVLSPLPVDGAFLAAGFSGHGFGMGPGAGALMAALVTGKTPPVDASVFHLSRLSDIARLTLGPL